MPLSKGQTSTRIHPIMTCREGKSSENLPTFRVKIAKEEDWQSAFWNLSASSLVNPLITCWQSGTKIQHQSVFRQRQRDIHGTRLSLRVNLRKTYYISRNVLHSLVFIGMRWHISPWLREVENEIQNRKDHNDPQRNIREILNNRRDRKTWWFVDRREQGFNMNL